jgi:hypothetical protein
MDDDSLEKIMLCMLMCQISECTTIEQVIRLAEGAKRAIDQAKKIFEDV